jgi:hypothetical protein
LVVRLSELKQGLDLGEVIQCQLIELRLDYELTQPQHQIQLVNHSIKDILNSDDIIRILLPHAVHSTLHLVRFRFGHLPLQQTLINTLNSFELQLQFSDLTQALLLPLNQRKELDHLLLDALLLLLYQVSDQAYLLKCVLI